MLRRQQTPPRPFCLRLQRPGASFLTTFYPEDWFSHVVIDECHRSAWGKWSQVLTRNENAAQIGLTATPRRKVISEIMTGVERVRIDTERNFLDVLDKVHQLTTEAVDPTHVFTLSQVDEGLLLKMGEKANDGGRCSIVLDEGLLFRTKEDAFVKTKRKLLDECDLWCIVSLPAGVFTAPGPGVKINLLFFTKGRPTQKI